MKNKNRLWQKMIWIAAALIVLGFLALLSSSFTTDAEKENNAPPEGMIDMKGDYGDFDADQGIDDPVHDPSIFKDEDTYYVASTGIASDEENPGGIYLRKSTEGIDGPWQSIGEIEPPDWTKAYNTAHLWAPDVVKKGNTFYLYYVASIFGTNNSAIGVAASTTPGDIESWEDHGPVLTSDNSVSYNAIDPEVFLDNGKWWMVFGSHFSGIHLQELQNMTEPTGEIVTLASRPDTRHNPVEAPTIIKNGKYYYLFTSWDRCCAGADSTYKIAVGRSESLTGPYTDKEGTTLTQGGGEVILKSEGSQIGPGGQDIVKDRGNYYVVYHYYDGDADGVIRMQIRSLEWKNNWPSLP